MIFFICIYFPQCRNRPGIFAILSVNKQVEYVKNIGIGGPRSSWRASLSFVIPLLYFFSPISSQEFCQISFPRHCTCMGVSYLSCSFIFIELEFVSIECLHGNRVAVASKSPTTFPHSLSGWNGCWKLCCHCCYIPVIWLIAWGILYISK